MLRWRDSVGFKSLELEALALAEDRVRRPEETEVKSPFHLVCCNDSDCEIIVPTTDWDIPVSQSAKVLKKLRWRSRPKRALIVKKPNDKDTTAALHKVHGFLTTRVPPIEVWVEPAVAKDLGAGFKTWEEDKGDDLHKYVDFVVCLGGDGTILWISRLFKNRTVPPVVGFALGSLGFLTCFKIQESSPTLTKVIEGDFFITLRMRLCGRIVRKSGEVVKLEDVTALNEVVIDRGPTYSLIQLELFCDGLPLTKVQADGVIIATPTGSTAYSLAAGGPLVHPALTGMLITPICPHTLSFRPMLLPDSVTLKIHVPETSRSNAFIAFDGSHRHELHKGDNVFIKFVTNPVIHMCKDNESADWFQSVNQALRWNERDAEQKPFEEPALEPVVELAHTESPAGPDAGLDF
ncbi:hypothetical protein CYMTET_9099 [Cymbomonas tetramitiformis]|uniref:NAD(+) kinase n=1 Tax=Cymbomonas tetramitiformis TaxID=36881 RepID=A0AAE0GRR6_9CHLO|nr:hypothetical protein CYMTET_9099 [Cymbomonas tetramitiformis]